jgi:CheY-like chemotaxis protein
VKSVRKNKSVLYVEDYDMLHSLMRDVLGSCTVVSALTAEIATDIIDSDPPFDLIMIGVNLGNSMNGFELCRVILNRSEYKQTPIGAISAVNLE